MSAVIEGSGVELTYEERGDGPVVLLVHGIGENRAKLEPVARGAGVACPRDRL